jgi:hypothetical protein
MIVYHGSSYKKLIDNSLDPRSYVTTDIWCAESYGINIYEFECELEDLEPDYYGLPPGMETNIFRIKHRFYPTIKEKE